MIAIRIRAAVTILLMLSLVVGVVWHVTRATAFEDARSPQTVERVPGVGIADVYQRALLRHLAADGRAGGDPFATSLISTTESWRKNPFYSALHASLSEIKVSRAVGAEFSGEEGKGLESVWICESAQGVVVASLRDRSISVSQSASLDEFNKVWDIAKKITPAPEKSDVHIARNALHATSYSVVQTSDAGVGATLCYDLPDNYSTMIASLIVELRKVDDGARRSSVKALK